MKIVTYNVFDNELAKELAWLESNGLELVVAKMVSTFQIDDEFEIILNLKDEEVTLLGLRLAGIKSFTIKEWSKS